MKKYEVVFIVKPLEEEATNAVIAKFENIVTAQGGTIDKIERWGKRRMAYEIKDLMDGYYCLFYITGEPKVVAELERVMKITDEIIKHMILRIEE